MKIRAAGKYFSYIAKFYPVMCASGAFPLMPPVVDAAKHLDRFDDLSQKGITKHIAKLKRFQSDIQAAEAKAANTVERATVRALALNISGALAELDTIRTWAKSPALYLQIAFIGLEQTISMPSKSERIKERRFIKRLKGIPALLSLATDNIDGINPSERAMAQTMIRDCARYLTNLGESDLGKNGKAPRFLADCFTALREFDKFVAYRPEIHEESLSFSEIATQVFGTDRHADEMYAIAEKEFNRRLAAIRYLEREMDTDWQTALADYNGPEEDDEQAFDVIIREIHRLRGFVFQTALPAVFGDSSLRLDKQPLHMASTLRPIHYDPALGVGPDESSHCYISQQIFSGRGFRDDPNRLKRMRREFPFMAARQSYPGRHLLDTQRRALGDHPMSQISSPFFAAGWLGFAENLLEELHYLEKPIDQIVHHQRGLARAALAMIDAGLIVGNVDQDKCMTILADAGFSTEEALEHVRAIRLSPASRIMQVLALYELQELRKRSGLPLEEFCRQLFAHGQLSFDDIGTIMNA